MSLDEILSSPELSRDDLAPAASIPTGPARPSPTTELYSTILSGGPSPQRVESSPSQPVSSQLPPATSTQAAPRVSDSAGSASPGHVGTTGQADSEQRWNSARRSISNGQKVSAVKGRQVHPPRCPATLAEIGMSLRQLCDLLLKQLYLQGNMVGIEIARQVRLPFQIVDEALQFLKEQKSLEVSSGEVIGPISYRFQLTEKGRVCARDAFEQCRYVGPAPVSIHQYVKQCREQTVTGVACTPDRLSRVFEDLTISPEFLQELGPAICSGRSIFLFGPPGNGKSSVAKRMGQFLDHDGGEIYVPYAIQADNSIITIFDPTIHHATDASELAAWEHRSNTIERGTAMAGVDTAVDWRWRRVRRPVVMTGGELTLQMLDLQYHRESNFYTAPLHMKANGGVFLIDDFGRQLVSPRDLLNRWVLPLEERIDFLTLAIGKKIEVPFEQLIVFSTNLEPRELVDEAFLRRIRHKVHIGPPSREVFTRIFEAECQKQGCDFDPDSVAYLFSDYYDRGKPPRSSDPRDLLEIAQSICRFRGQEVRLSVELIAECCQRFFGQAMSA